MPEKLSRITSRKTADYPLSWTPFRYRRISFNSDLVGHPMAHCKRTMFLIPVAQICIPGNQLLTRIVEYLDGSIARASGSHRIKPTAIPWEQI
jgi:hypothetical protein